MKKMKIKKFLVTCLCGVMVLSVGIGANAATNDSEYPETETLKILEGIPEGELVGVTTNPIYEVNESNDVYGLNKPTDLWDLGTQGAYQMRGTTSGYTLYSNYKFYGQDSYKLLIKNYADTTLVVKFKRGAVIAKRATVAAGEAVTISYDPLLSSAEFYLQFDCVGGSIDLEGVIY